MNPRERAMYYGYLLTQGMSEEEARRLSGMDVGPTPMVNNNSQTVDENGLVFTPQQSNPSFQTQGFQTPLGTNVSGNWWDTSDLTGNQNANLSPGVQPKQYITDPNQRDTNYLTPGPEDVMNNTYSPSKKAGNFMSMLPYLFPGGSDISTELYSMGRGIGKLTAKDAEGNRTVTGLERAGAWGNVIGGGGAALLDATRNLTSGIGFERANQYVEDWYKKKQRERPNFTNAPQFRNANYTGGATYSKYGGLFEDGGEMDETIEEGVEMASNNEQQNQMQQIASQVAQALQQGQEPQAVMQALIQKGIPQQQAQQIVQMVMQQIQQEQDMYSENEEEGGEEEEQQEPQEKESETLMKRGGRFKYNVGDYIEFMHGGVKKAGKIKEIKNGKVFL